MCFKLPAKDAPSGLLADVLDKAGPLNATSAKV